MTDDWMVHYDPVSDSVIFDLIKKNSRATFEMDYKDFARYAEQVAEEECDHRRRMRLAEKRRGDDE